MVSLAVTLPFVGWIVALAAVVVGVGALALERRSSIADLRAASRA
jgi:hypothetical protein